MNWLVFRSGDARATNPDIVDAPGPLLRKPAEARKDEQHKRAQGLAATRRAHRSESTTHGAAALLGLLASASASLGYQMSTTARSGAPSTCTRVQRSGGVGRVVRAYASPPEVHDGESPKCIAPRQDGHRSTAAGRKNGYPFVDGSTDLQFSTWRSKHLADTRT